MATIVWTQSDIDKLKAAMALGVKKVVYDGPPKREQEFQSLSEMRDLLAEMRAEVDAASSSPSPVRRLAKTSKGFR